MTSRGLPNFFSVALRQGTQYAMRYRLVEAKLQQELGNVAAASDLYAEANGLAARLGILERYVAEETAAPEELLLAPHQIDIYVASHNLIEIDFRPSRGSVITATSDTRRVPLFDAIQKSDWGETLTTIYATRRAWSETQALSAD